MIVAGEPSGDAHSASLVRSLLETEPQTRFEFFGSTGPQMREAGVETIVRADDLAIMGILEVGRVLPRFWRAFRALKNAALERKPDAVILVDWPEFNLRLARALHRNGIKIVYYISPQVWAWRSYRARQIQRDVDQMLCILPFEPDWYAKRGITNAQFVGHPLTGEIHPRYEREEFCRRYDLDKECPIVALLPGSRHMELERILPPMLDAVSAIHVARAEIQFVLAMAANLSITQARTMMTNRKDLPVNLKIVQGETREVLAAADVAAIASGTATLESAIIGTPFVMVYKESAVNWHTLGRLITAEHYGLVNLIAGEHLITELMQHDLNGERLSGELIALLDQGQNSTMRTRLHDTTLKLGKGDASLRAANAILTKLSEWR